MFCPLNLKEHHFKILSGNFKRYSIWKTKSYNEIAILYGNSKATRAVGKAISQNPIMIFIPCHRVIGSDGSLTGYAGGINKKKWLLEFEGYPIQKSLDL